MFLPIRTPLLDKLPSLPRSGLKRYFALGAVFVLTVALSLIVSSTIRGWAVDSLFTFYSTDAAYISLGKIDRIRLQRIVEVVQKDEAVQSRLANAGGTESPRFINYVLPAEWFVSEIPMNAVKGAGGHHAPAPSDGNRYKIVFTLATLRWGNGVSGRDLILNTVTRTPVMEVWIDLAGEELRIEEPPEAGRYEGVPVPIF